MQTFEQERETVALKLTARSSPFDTTDNCRLCGGHLDDNWRFLTAEPGAFVIGYICGMCVQDAEGGG